MEYKRCTKCGIDKPLTEFGKRKRSNDGLNYWCRQCNRDNTKKWIEDYPDNYRASYIRWQSNNPQKIKEYWLTKGRLKGIVNSRKYRANHPGWSSESAKRWRANNPGYSASYRISHRDYILTWFAKHRAEKKNAPGNGVTYAECYERYGKKCLCCGSEERIEMDHVIPLSRGGAHDIANVQPLCRHCNASKNNKTIDYRYKGAA